MHISKRIFVVVATLLLISIPYSAQSQAKELPPLVPGKLDWDYIGNSFSDFAVGRWQHLAVFVEEDYKAKVLLYRWKP